MMGGIPYFADDTSDIWKPGVLVSTRRGEDGLLCLYRNQCGKQILGQAGGGTVQTSNSHLPSQLGSRKIHFSVVKQELKIQREVPI